MAKIQYSAVVGDARGKVGGNVLTKGRAGPVVRTKVSPVQPRTSHQREVRSRFTAESKAWSALATDALRAAWDAFAKANPVKNVFGATRWLTGHQMFVRLNAVILKCLGTAITAPPLSLSIAEPLTVVVTAAHGTPTVMTVTITGPPTGNECAEVWGAAPQSAGRKFIGGAYRELMVGAAAGTGPFDLGGWWDARFGTLQAGQIVRVLVKYASKTTGAQGMGVEAKCTAT
jgi:hypothetical protein